MLMEPTSWQYFIRQFGPMDSQNGIRMSFFGYSRSMLDLNG